MQIYKEDDRFDEITRKENFEYHQKCRELFFRGIAIMNGEITPNLEMLKKPERFFSEAELSGNDIHNPSQTLYQENFWLNLLLRVNLLESVISENDKKVLKYLKKMDIIKYPDNENYSVEFYFEENEYFENEKLVVSVHIDDDDDYDLNIEEIRGELIEWKPNKNYLVNIVNGEEKRMANSFFWFFKSFKAVDFENNDDEECIEYDMDDLSDRSLFFVSKDIAGIFRDYFFVYLIPSVYGVEIP